MQHNDRFAAPVADDFHVSPPDSANSCSQCLGDRFLGCEPSGEFVDPGPVSFAFPFGKDTVQESFAEISERAFDACYFYQVDPDDDPAALFWIKFGDVHSVPFTPR